MTVDKPAGDAKVRVDGAHGVTAPAARTDATPPSESVLDDHDAPHDDPGATWIDPDQTHIQKH